MYLGVPADLVTSYSNSHVWNQLCGTFWSQSDIGKDSDHDQGMLFRLGDPTGHYPSENFQFTEQSYREYISQKDSDSYYSIVTEQNVFDPVSQNFGSHWRYPTEEDIKNLYTYYKAAIGYKTVDSKCLNFLDGNLIVMSFDLTDSNSVTMRIKRGLVTMYKEGYTIQRYNYTHGTGNNYFQNLTKACYGGYIIRPILNISARVSMAGITGNYNDLINKPTIPAAQIQADWNQSDNTALDYIKNKPSLFSGSYADLSNKPSIPAAQIQADWNQTDNTALDYIKNKPTIPSSSGTSTQIQADWNQSDNTALDYIKNKPTIPTVPASETATNGGSTLSVVTTGEKYTWNNKASIWSGTQAQYTALSPNYDSNTIYIITAS